MMLYKVIYSPFCWVSWLVSVAVTVQYAMHLLHVKERRKYFLHHLQKSLKMTLIYNNICMYCQYDASFITNIVISLHCVWWCFCFAGKRDQCLSGSLCKHTLQQKKTPAGSLRTASEWGKEPVVNVWFIIFTACLLQHVFTLFLTSHLHHTGTHNCMKGPRFSFHRADTDRSSGLGWFPRKHLVERQLSTQRLHKEISDGHSKITMTY